MAYYIMDLKDILQALEQGQDTLKKEEEYKIFCGEEEGDRNILINNNRMLLFI